MPPSETSSSGPGPDIELPESIIAAIRSDLRERGLEPATIGPGDSTFALADLHEQYYVASAKTKLDRDVRVLYRARKDGETWTVDHLRTTER